MPATRRAAAAAALAIAPLVLLPGASAASAASAGSMREVLDCVATVPGVTARGIPTTFRYDEGRTSSQRRGPGDLGYQPRDIAHPHHATTSSRTAMRATTTRRYWFTLSGQQLREVTETDRIDGEGNLLSAAYRSRLVRKGWSGIRQMSIGQGRKFLYVLNNRDQLLRYKFSGKNGNAYVQLNATIGTGFGNLGTFEYARTISILGSKHDVFLATDADSDELLEYTIPVSNPTAYRRTVLDQGGWADMRSAGRSVACVGSGGRSYDGIVAVDIFGAVRLWTDRNGSDGLGSDIVDRGIIKSLWRPMPYSN
jgi:hypothetical protein